MRTLTLSLLATTVLASAFAASAFAVDTGFESGNKLTARAYRGELIVNCMAPGNSQIYFYACTDERLDPAEAAKFVTAPGVDADHVALSASWENGKTVKKDTDFDSASGKSTREFNLWISTLFQRPLLNYGENKIHYVLSKDGQTQSEGDFKATVEKAPVAQCNQGMLMETFAGNCTNPYFMCQRYFQESARCE